MPVGEPLKILLVEDDPAFEGLIQHFMRTVNPEGFLLQTAPTLSEGVEILSHQPIDLVMLDLGLPDSQGLNTYIQLQRADPRVPVIVMTSSMPDIRDGQHAVALGAQDYVGKDDITPQLLSRAIPYAIGRKQILLDLQVAQRIARIGNWQVALDTAQWLASPALYELMGLDPFEESFQLFDDYLEKVVLEDQPKVQKAYEDAIRLGTSFMVEHQCSGQNGEIRSFSLQGEVEHTHLGVAVRVIGTVQDITHLKRIKSLEAEKALAEKEARIRQEFLAKTSHEIRTPLNPILVLTRLLLDSSLTEEQRHQVETIRSAGNTLLALVNDILDISKIEAGKIDFTHEAFTLSEVLETVMNMMAPSAIQKQIHLEVLWDEDIPDLLVGDKVRLLQVLLNLISNGIKFTQTGSVVVKIEAIRGNKPEEAIFRFSVIDTGIGIPQNKLKEIFEGFRQLNNSMTTPSTGTGLGLTIVRQLVQMQGGDISVESEEGRGSTFTFWLPFGIVPGSGVPLPLDPSGKSSKHHTQTRKKEPFTGLKILLVEDDPLNQLVTCNLLEKWEVEVSVANNGQEAVDRLTKKSYDLVLMDLQMPIMDGLEATRHIRSELPAPVRDIPIIALTANAFLGSASVCFQAGMNDFISKPIEIDNLYSKIVPYHETAMNAGQEDSRPDTANDPDSDVSESADPTVVGAPSSPPPQHEEEVPRDSQSAMSEHTYTDLTYIREITGNDADMVRKTISKFLDNTPTMAQTMQQNLQDEAYGDLQRIVHKMKSSVEFMGIAAIKDNIQRILEITRNEQSDEYLELPGHVQRIQEVLKIAYEELKEARDKL